MEEMKAKTEMVESEKKKIEAKLKEEKERAEEIIWRNSRRAWETLRSKPSTPGRKKKRFLPRRRRCRRTWTLCPRQDSAKRSSTPQVNPSMRSSLRRRGRRR